MQVWHGIRADREDSTPHSGGELPEARDGRVSMVPQLRQLGGGAWIPTADGSPRYASSTRREATRCFGSGPRPMR